ncbi:MAG: hypothetical protein ACKVLN_15615 [Rhodobacterales bacterium]
MPSSAGFDLEHMLAGFMRRAHFPDVFSLTEITGGNTNAQTPIIVKEVPETRWCLGRQAQLLSVRSQSQQGKKERPYE